MLAMTRKATGAHVRRPVQRVSDFQGTVDPNGFLVAVRTNKLTRPNKASKGLGVRSARAGQIDATNQCCGAPTGVGPIFLPARKPTSRFAATDVTRAKVVCATTSSGGLPQAVSRRRTQRANRRRAFMEGCAFHTRKQ
jgi:hypothetical protein